MSRVTLVKNAFANVCRGGAAALIMLLMPPFLTKIISKDAYGTWLLILQLATYVSILDFGIQTAVGRYVAHHNELGEVKERDKIVNTSLAILVCSGLVALIGVCLLSLFLPGFFKDMPAELRQDAQWSLLLVGSSLAISLPSSVFGGIFIGLQRYDIPAWIIGLSKLLGGVAVVIVANYTHSIIMMALVTGAANLLAGFFLFFEYKKNPLSRSIIFSPKFINKKSFIEVRNYCFGLSIWMIGMTLGAGMDTTVLAFFDYKSVVYYNISMVFVNVMIGIQNHSISVIMPMTAAAAAQNDRKRVGEILIDYSRYSAVILTLVSVPILIFAPQIVNVWLGKEYVNNVVPLLRFLIIANFFRQLSVPYYFVMASLAKQSIIAPTLLLEGIINFILSIVLVNIFGAIGVAIATLIGSFINILMNFVYNISRTTEVMQINNKKQIFVSLLRPLISAAPIILFILGSSSIESNSITYAVLSSITFISFLFLLWFIGLNPSERNSISTKIKIKLQKA
jgi:O-antigen/teichoic acid export membrane protein